MSATNRGCERKAYDFYATPPETVQAFLANFDGMAKRVDFFQQRDVLDVKVDCTMRRTKVCAREIFCECWGRPKNAWKRQDGYDIAGIMARIPGWEKTGREARVPGYGHQRVYTRVEE